MNARIDQLLGELTVDEKAAMVAGVDLWHTAAVPRLGIPALKVTDGPGGARGERWSGRNSASFPCGTALGATWNPDLVRTVGERIGGEARRKGAHVLLAPTVNNHRHPLAGRNFECYSEDPFLSARLAVAYIGGVQSTGVGCSVKHFVANDSEFERMTISSEVDARTLREISLVPFEAAVLEAGTWSVMAAYNRVHGTYCSEHPLLIDLLKQEWAFDGVIMSDWYGTHSTVPAANAGLDLEMPGPAQFFSAPLAEAVRAGEVDEKVLDDKVRRMLVLLDRAGALDHPDPVAEQSIDDPEDRAVARRAAAESFVLLRNRGDALPIEAMPATSSGTELPLLAVIGPNAAVAMIQGGGSARVSAFTPVTPLAGLRDRFGATFRIEHERGCSSYKQTPILDDSVFDGTMHVSYYAGRERAGEPVLVEPANRAWFTFTGPFTPEVPEEFSMRVTGTLVAPESGTWTFGLVQVGRAKLSIDGELVVDNWQPTGRSDAFMGFGSSEVTGTVRSRRGRAASTRGRVRPGRSLDGWTRDRLYAAGARRPDGTRGRARGARRRGRVRGRYRRRLGDRGRRSRFDGRCRRRKTSSCASVAAVNQRTIVAVNAASPVEMNWAEDCGRDPAMLVRGRRVGQRAGRRALRRRVAVGKVADDHSRPYRRHARVQDLPR